MIIYFSATGNNQYLARTIAESIGDNAKSILEFIKEDVSEINIADGEVLGIVVPTYFIGLPSIVDEFLSSVKINASPDTYVFTMASYGTSTGYALGYLEDYMKDNNLTVNAQFKVRMPDTWTVMFDLTDKNQIDNENLEVDRQLEEIIPVISNRDDTEVKNSFFNRISANFARLIYDRQRKTSHLHVLDSCTSCGKCAENCPISAIEIVDGRPVWQYDYCVICLRCLHICPTFSIQYDDKTIDHGQYVNPHIDKLD